MHKKYREMDPAYRNSHPDLGLLDSMRKISRTAETVLGFCLKTPLPCEEFSDFLRVYCSVQADVDGVHCFAYSLFLLTVSQLLIMFSFYMRQYARSIHYFSYLRKFLLFGAFKKKMDNWAYRYHLRKIEPVSSAEVYEK